MNRRPVAVGIASLSAILIVGFFVRDSVADAWRMAHAPEVPAAVGWQQVVETRPEVTIPDVTSTPIQTPDAEEQRESPTTSSAPASSPVFTTTPTPNTAPVEPFPPTNSELPTTINLAVPFTSQAPDGVWNALHEDACEEAAVYMVIRYYQGATETVIAVEEANAELERVVQLETSMGLGVSISAQEVVDTVEAGYDGFRAELVTNPTVDDLKQLLADGHPVIVPAAGRQLGNPNFSGEGPLYHMYTLRGYTEEGFITNEPGTRLGRNYFYSTNTVMNAIRDWNGGDVYNGARVVIVIYPE